MKSEEIKKRQHYVFQAYLKRWTDTDNQLSVMKNGKISQSGTRAIAYEPFFYELKNLNKDEDKLLKLLIGYDSAHPSVKCEIQKHNQLYQIPLKQKEYLKKLESFLIERFGSSENIPDNIKDTLEQQKTINETKIINSQENFYSFIEDELSIWLDLIEKKDTSFYNSPDTRYHFLHSVCMQYFRTKSLKQTWVQKMTASTPKYKEALKECQIDLENINWQNISPYYFWNLENLCTFHLLKNSSHMIIYENNTNYPFITSDQPVINLDGINSEDANITNLTLYYPISPRIAIVIGNTDTSPIVDISEEKVKEFNHAIAKASYEYVFASNEEILNIIKSDMPSICKSEKHRM